MIVISWNVNSLRVRLDHVLRLLDQRAPDVLCLQETRGLATPAALDAFGSRGYELHAAGSGGYAGVATLTTAPLQDVVVGFVTDAANGVGRRLLGRVGDVWVDNIYVPTRRAIGKSEFLDQLRTDYEARFVADREPLVLCGDFNICFDERDLASLRMITEGEMLGRRPEDVAFRRLVGFGLQDCFRIHHEDGGSFSWFPLTPWALKRNYGMRLDYIFATSRASSRCLNVEHDVTTRSWPKPSDHLPVIAQFAD